MSTPALAQQATNTVSVSTPDNADPDPSGNTATDSDVVVRLSAQKVAVGLSNVQADGSYIATYRITVANSSAADTVYGDLIDTLDYPTEVEVLGVSWTCTTTGCASGSASGLAPIVLARGGTAINAGVTHVYEVQVRLRHRDPDFEGSCATGNGLANSISLPLGQESDLSDNSACLNLPQVPAATLSLVKTGTVSATAKAGDRISYNFLVTNTGPLTVSGLTIADPKLDSSANCNPLTLNPGESVTCTGVYTLTQADVNAGLIENTATVGGKSPFNDDVTSPPSTAEVEVTRTPAMTLEKIAGTPSGSTAGSTLDYTFNLENTGNVTLTDLVIHDALLDAPATCAVTYLDPGQSTTCTGLRTLTQADIDAGKTVNTATASATPPGGPPGDVVTPPSTTETPHSSSAALTIVKTAGTPSSQTVGGVIPYSFRVTNTGNVTLDQIEVLDGLLDAPAVCEDLTLAPGDYTTCVGQRTLTLADVNAGEVINTATAQAVPPSGGSVASPPSTAEVEVTRTPAMTLEKIAGTPSGATAGSTLDYTFNLENTGNVTLTDLVIHDALLDAPATCAVTYLDPGQSTTCTGLRTLTQADIDAGKTVNTATASATPPGGTPGDVVTPPSTTETPHQGLAAISLVKSTEQTDFGWPGDVLSYSYLVTNTGNLSLSAVSVTDDRISNVLCPDDTLLPGASFTCTADYVVTQDDIELGYVTNIAEAKGVPPRGEPVEGTDTVTVGGTARPALTLEKSSLSALFEQAGQVLTYHYRVTNTGNVTIRDLQVSDDRISNVVCPVDVLAPKEVVTCAADYVVAQADLELGFITNIATATGTPTRGELEPVTDTLTLEADLRPSLAVEKLSHLSLDKHDIGLANAYDEITYQVSVTNTGNITLHDVQVEDIYQGGASIFLDCAPMVLAPGEMATCAPYVHVVTQAEANVGGLLENIAIASGQPTGGSGTVTGRITEQDSVTTEVAAPQTMLRIVKQAAPRDVRTGDIVRYSVVIENIGLTDAEDVTLFDTPPAGFTLIENSLSVADRDGQGRLSGTRPFRVDQIDINVGQRATITYLLKVGAGVRPGTHVNTAMAQDEEYTSNTATAEVRLVGDPLMDDSLILGTVFDDRDGDGWQDPAHADEVVVQGGLAPSVMLGASRINGAVVSGHLGQGVEVGHIAARQSIADTAPKVVISQTVSAPRFEDDFVVTTRQGLTVRYSPDGNISRHLSGEAEKGLVATDLQVERRVSRVEDGYQVDYIVTNHGIDERGIAGVRLASVEGLLIETDPYGRYHLTGVEGGPWERGRNFILSVDPSSLPKGSVFTTDNPKLRRITPGLPVRFDFGVQLPVEVIGGGTEEVVMKLAEFAFTPASTEVRSLYDGVLDHMANEIRTRGAGEIIIAANGETYDLAYGRAVAVREAMAKRLSAEDMAKMTVTVQTDREDTQNWVARIEDTTVLGQVLFITDKWDVLPEFEPLLDRVADKLVEVHAEAGSEMLIRLVGQTDLRLSDAYNMRLGLRRSQAVFEALAKRLPPELRNQLRVESSNDQSAPNTATTASAGL